MSDEPTERDVEALWRWFHNHGDGGVWETFDRPNSEVVARAVLTSDWYAERVAEARREGAAALVDTVVRNWQGGTGHTDTNKWVSIADLKKYAAALRGDA